MQETKKHFIKKILIYLSQEEKGVKTIIFYDNTFIIQKLNVQLVDY